MPLILGRVVSCDTKIGQIWAYIFAAVWIVELEQVRRIYRVLYSESCTASQSQTKSKDTILSKDSLNSWVRF